MEPSVTNRTLVIVAHPDLGNSRANASRLAEITDMSNVTVHDLYREYPDFTVDVAREQQLLRDHDTVILQFPLHWYNVTPLLKAWLDAVLVYGFAFTFDGSASALRGKKAWLAVSAGSTLDTYRTDGLAGRPLDEYLAPVSQTLQFCQFDYRGVHAVYGLMFDPQEEDLVLDAKEFSRYVATSQTPVD
jgi:glutathione-regulated potassium-efflux system ancillary protein KefG